MKILVVLFLLEYFVSLGQAVPPTMVDTKQIYTLAENDLSQNGNQLYDFAADCTGTGPFTFTYTMYPAVTSTLLDPQLDGKVMMLASAAPNYEVAVQYNLWATCNDTATGELGVVQGAFSLVLTDVNEVLTCTCATKTITIGEIGSANTVLTEDNGISVTDPEQGTLTWTILPASTGKGFYFLTPSTGFPATTNISTNIPIDYEDTAISGTPCRDLIIQISDAASNLVSATISICVTDDNDNAPVFNPTSYTGTFFGIGTAVNTAITTVAATDADSTAANQISSYEVSTLSPTFPYVKFVGSSLRVNNPIDVQFKDYFEVIIYAIDGGTPQYTATGTVTIYTTTTTTTTTTTAKPPDYNFWNNKDNVIAFTCLMIITGLIVGGLCYGLYNYCRYGTCLPDCCTPADKGDVESKGLNDKGSNSGSNKDDNDDYDFARSTTPNRGISSPTDIGYHRNY